MADFGIVLSKNVIKMIVNSFFLNLYAIKTLGRSIEKCVKTIGSCIFFQNNHLLELLLYIFYNK